MSPDAMNDLLDRSRSVFRTAGFAGVLAGIVTAAIVFLPYLYGQPMTFQERLDLHGNPWYLLQMWLSYLNVFLILLAALGLSIHRVLESPGAALSGLLFMVLYGATELIGRSIMIFTREYRWVHALEGASDETRLALIDSIRLFDQVWVGAFPLILISFTLSAFLFAFALRGGDRLQRITSAFLIAAGALGIVTFLAMHFPSLGSVASWGYIVIQSTSRLLVGVFLLKAAGGNLQPVKG